MTGLDYFEGLYEQSSDPWDLTSRSHERRKYALTIASLPDRAFRRAFEPGCSVGVLTELLAARCEVVIASDPVARALDQAHVRAPGAQLLNGALPGTWPEGVLDLVVLSEVLYYLAVEDRAATISSAHEHLEPGGVLVSVHWRHPFVEAECDGDQVQRELRAADGFAELVWHEERDFTILVLGRE